MNFLGSRTPQGKKNKCKTSHFSERLTYRFPLTGVYITQKARLFPLPETVPKNHRFRLKKVNPTLYLPCMKFLICSYDDNQTVK